MIRRFGVQFEFAIAAIAAAGAALTQMVSARILRAMRADARRFRVADTAGECRWCHFVFVVTWLSLRCPVCLFRRGSPDGRLTCQITAAALRFLIFNAELLLRRVCQIQNVLLKLFNAGLVAHRD